MRLFAISLVLTAATALPAFAAEVRLRSSAACSSAIVRVGDVAEVFAEDARVVDALSDVALFPAPVRGAQKTLTQGDIRELLVQSGVDRKTATVTGSESIIIGSEFHTRAAPSSKRPMVASGVRQAMFETDTEPTRKPSARGRIKPQPSASVEDRQPAETPVIEQGAVVTVTARTAGVKITTSGKALDDGTTGDTIGVELTDGKQRVLARVKGPQVVEVME